ncbi:hypothetical protein KEC55_30655 [Burkholderia cepacia]|nr:hypothetical protein KEC55_30655 [Burkholderia cepacia]
MSCVAALAIPVSAIAAIDIVPKEVAVRGEVTSVEVINNGDRNEYVKISLSRLLNPGVPLDRERLEPIGEIAQPSLYAYPFRMSLAPGQTKTLVLKALHPIETEIVYRLDVKPVVKVLDGGRTRPAASVVANLAFSGIVRQLPAKPRRELTVSCEGSGALLTATGNVHYRVEGAKADGQKLDDFNVYPGVPIPVQGRVVAVPGYPACSGATPVNSL